MCPEKKEIRNEKEKTDSFYGTIPIKTTNEFKKEYHIVMLFLVTILLLQSCDDIAKTGNSDEIVNQHQITGLWLPVKTELLKKNTNYIDSTIMYPGYNYFYEFTEDSFHYIELAMDTLCYHRGSTASFINNSELVVLNFRQKISITGDTLTIKWINDDKLDAIVYSTRWKQGLPKAICAKDTATSIDDLPTHEKP